MEESEEEEYIYIRVDQNNEIKEEKEREGKIETILNKIKGEITSHMEVGGSSINITDNYYGPRERGEEKEKEKVVEVEGRNVERKNLSLNGESSTTTRNSPKERASPRIKTLPSTTIKKYSFPLPSEEASPLKSNTKSPKILFCLLLILIFVFFLFSLLWKQK